ncbi:MAG: hypothetical protein PHE02_05780 [Lachnospiraceae bacterium]|nr:hypothetical protein [Lachnospiraceae bacterium]
MQQLDKVLLDMSIITENKFVKHYMDIEGIGIFLLVAFIGLVVVIGILLLYARQFEDGESREEEDMIDLEEEETFDLNNEKGRGHRKRKKKKMALNRTTCWFIESFYELVFSSTSILFFLAAYYLIDRYLDIREYRVLWDEYSDVLLMAFIFMSIFLNTFLDHLVVSLRTINSRQKGALRLVSTIYMMLIFGYIRFIYDDLNYNELIIYFMGLVIGRFVYFDFTWKDFSETIRGVIKNLPLLLLIVSYSGLMCYVGFRSKFLLTANGVIVSILIAHVFMDVSILIIHHVMKHMREDRMYRKENKKKAKNRRR